MQEATQILDELNVAYHVEVVSAHRTPTNCLNLPKMHKKWLQSDYWGAGGAAHLPGMIAAKTLVPVLGVPVKSSMLSGVDSLYSISTNAERHSCRYVSDWPCWCSECRITRCTNSCRLG